MVNSVLARLMHHVYLTHRPCLIYLLASLSLIMNSDLAESMAPSWPLPSICVMSSQKFSSHCSGVWSPWMETSKVLDVSAALKINGVSTAVKSILRPADPWICVSSPITGEEKICLFVCLNRNKCVSRPYHGPCPIGRHTEWRTRQILLTNE